MLRVTLLFLFIFTSLFSEDVEEFPFLGISVSTQTMDISTSNPKETSFAIRYGKQTIDWRTMFSYVFAGNGYRSFSMEIDKILLDELIHMPELRPYLGLAVGSIAYDINGAADDSGYFYGINAGLIIYATDTMDADLSYHYYKVKSFDDLDKIKGASLSLHYFY
jgi:hypothetical protein